MYFFYLLYFNVLTIVKLLGTFKNSFKTKKIINLFSHNYLVAVPQVEKLPANNEKIKQHNEGKA